MIAGLVLKDTEGEDSYIAFLNDGASCQAVETNRDILELVKEKNPEVLAADVGTRIGAGDRTEGEKELEEEGYSFTPASHESKRVRRMEALKKGIFDEMGASGPQVIRFDPYITADELGIHGDEGLESFGVDTAGIETSEQFDAMLGAVTARFYQENQVEDMGVIVPQPLDQS